jgi:lipid II:glycine glycyltransferase (peptidoglycan interpeptide bridge formation enzyme)
VFTYVPFGPYIPEPETAREELLKGIACEAASHLSVDPRPGGDHAEATSELAREAFAVRFDLAWGKVGLQCFSEPLREGSNLRKAPVDIQPPSTVIVDLRPEEQTILASMKHKTRYNIRLASKRGVEVRERGIEGLPQWYALYRETAQRDRISIHSLDYYKGQFELSRKYGVLTSGADSPGVDPCGVETPEYKLLLATKHQELLAGIIVVFWKKTARYLFGASSSRMRNLMATYALQWRAMQMAREAGCLEYDLFGIPPSNDPHHPMHGLFQFKTGFGGSIVNRLGCWDIVLKRPRYKLYKKAEEVRRFYHQVVRKRVGL